MIDKIKIENFKSIVDLEFDPGRFNIIIGANGCGKTNILEAITIASAASQNRLDNEFLGSRLRNTKPAFMFSAFEENQTENPGYIAVRIAENPKPATDFHIVIDGNTGKWVNLGDFINDQNVYRSIEKLIENELIKEAIGAQDKFSDFESLQQLLKSDDKEKIKTYIPNFYSSLKASLFSKPALESFLIYCPEESNLRRFSDDSQVLPLGRRGEGLFQHLKDIYSKEENADIISDINEGLLLLDWIDGFKIPSDLLSNEYRLEVGDKYLKKTLHYFDQRSTNEGFLYLLFYLTLFASKQTPLFFAIDNIENSFNPKLCTMLIRYLVQLAKKHDKQVILTTHNPYILDGLELEDDEQRLFVARRNIDGHTKLDRVEYKKERTMPLSEIWMNGFIGGLPDNF